MLKAMVGNVLTGWMILAATSAFAEPKYLDCTRIASSATADQTISKAGVLPITPRMFLTLDLDARTMATDPLMISGPIKRIEDNDIQFQDDLSADGAYRLRAVLDRRSLVLTIQMSNPSNNAAISSRIFECKLLPGAPMNQL